jgi:ankyrin repeat protein
MLLHLGASANNTDDFGNSPLAHYLSQFHFSIDPEICQLLLKYGTNVESVNKAGKTLAELYATYGEVKVEVLQLFKEYEVDMDKTNSEGMTLLHTIALRGSLTEEGLIFLLGNSNIHQNMKDSSGKTALQYAMREAEQKRHQDQFDLSRWSRTADILRMYTT